ncbi:hypothetical protein VTN00DRAFT_3562 [Thermoascus crustaceus]|uniref:uncharacterized protein n=1 Tax=Thermoascus crustaceus TaxID=5088 RepID=UPI003743F607
MSFPKHTPSPLSSSPSKQSSRGNAGAQPSRPWAIGRASTHQQQREQYDTTQDQQQFHGQQQTEEGFTPHDHAERRQSLESSPHPQFRPFFTLIEDANSSDYHHPTVHYIFSDDDTDLVTEAALRALEADHGTSPPTGKGTSRWRQAAVEQQDEEPYGEEDELEGRQSGPRKTSSLPPPIPGVREHYIILDMEPSNPEPQGADTSTAPATAAPGGTTSLSTSPVAQHHQPNQPQTYPPSLPFTITSAHSLTPSWQVLDTQLTPAPTFENSTTNGEHPGSGSLMLKIKGTAGLPRDKIVRDRDGQTLEEMMEQFERRMDELRRVIEVGGHVPAGEREPETREREEGAETAAGAERQQRMEAEDVGPDEVGMEQTDTHYEQEEGGQATTGPDEHEDETTQREGA